MNTTRYVFPTSQFVRYRFPTHTNDLVLDRAEATTSEVFIVVLEPGEAPPRHVHHDTEQIFYILSGAGVLRIGEPEQEFPVQPGDIVRIPPSLWHSIRCDGAETLRYVSVDCFVSGRPAAEPTWDSHVRTVCVEQGWEFDTVKLG